MAKLLLPLLVVGLAALAAANYCTVDTKHTMCKFPDNKAGKACNKSAKAKALTNADKLAILKAHNTLRNKIALGQETRGKTKQPAAANMMKLKWDNELQKVAQRWAIQCKFEHDTCRTALDGTNVGQNIYWTASTAELGAVDWAGAVQDWYDEVAHRDGRLNTAAFKSTAGPVTGHFTQVAWAETTKVGCGYVDYVSVQSGTKMNSRMVICNYKESGNFMGKKMYEAGAAASKCPAGTKKDATYKGLCA